MGPGFHSHVESEWLGTTGIEFWNQPMAQGPKAFSELVQSTRIKILELRARSSERVHILAHCFGVQVITTLLPELEEAVGDCLFLSASRPRIGFHHFLKKLAQESRVPTDIREKIETYLRLHPVPLNETFGSTIGMLLQVPDFMSYYWKDQNLYEKYVEICSRHSTLDLNMFSDVMNEFLPWQFVSPRTTSHSQTIEFIFGSESPFVEFESEKEYWNKLFPTASFELIPDVGHNIHLESKLFKDRLNRWLRG